MTCTVLKQWRADLPAGSVFSAADHGLSQLDVGFLLAAGFIENDTTEEHQPAKLKPKKRKD